MFSSLLSWEMGGGGFCFGFWGVGFLGGFFFFLVLKKKFPSFLTECCCHHHPLFRGLCLYLCPGFCCRKSHCKGKST